MDREEVKSALTSKGVQGSVVAVIGGVLTYLEMSGTISTGADLTPVVAILGGLWSLYGRLKATKSISSWF